MNVGGVDAFGVGFTSTGGSYTTRVVSSYAYISDGEGHEVSTSYRSDGDGRMGFGFRIQDYLYRKTNDAVFWPPTTDKFLYIGKHFAGLSRYDSNFSAYNGIATSYYVHSYDKAVVNGVTFAG